MTASATASKVFILPESLAVDAPRRLDKKSAIKATLAPDETVILLLHPPVTSTRCFNRDKQGGAVKMTVLSFMARRRCRTARR